MTKRRVLLLFSHELTESQRLDLWGQWAVDEELALPDDLQKLWSEIPPDLPVLQRYLEPLVEWLREVARRDDLALIQGDYGATYLLVQEAFRLGLVPVYSTTERVVSEEKAAGGEVVQRRVFRHSRFRVYGE